MKKILYKIDELNKYVIGWFPIAVGVTVLAWIGWAQQNGCLLNPDAGSMLTIVVGFASLFYIGNKFGKVRPGN